MKGLRKYLTPFAPDQSGAVSMCYALGGMVVIVDAGGCAGNICGFDEPRWQPDYMRTFDLEKSGTVLRVAAVFSAGLRDMDAILGRDDLLVKKLAEASKQIDVKFIALVGTPVPAVIGTDLSSDAVMAEKLTNLPCISISADGMHLYDKGIEEALLVLTKRFAQDAHTDKAVVRPGDGKNLLPGQDAVGKGVMSDTLTDTPEHTPGEKRICGVLGLNPLDLFDPAWTEAVRSALLSSGYEEVLLIGMDRGLDALKMIGRSEMNYVVSPAGIAAAKYLKERFGTPYEVSFPADPMILLEDNPAAKAAGYGQDTRILVVHQQVIANSIRGALRAAGATGRIVTATWFDFKPELSDEGDLSLKEEDEFISLVREGDWNLIIADPALRPMASDYRGRWINAYHFAVSGQLAIDQSQRTKDLPVQDQKPEQGMESGKVEVWRI